MKKIFEDLNQVKVPEQSNASQEAQKKKLNYVGFGRYVDPKTGQVTHIVQNDKLVPFNRAVKTNTFKTNNADDYGSYGAIMAPQIEELHNYLTTAYTPEKYDDAELDAIYNFSDTAYSDINARLSSLPSNVAANKIEKTSLDDTMPEFIATMDSAMKKIRTPIDFLTYTRLSADYRVQDFAKGLVFKFKGYRDTSISMNAVLNSAQAAQTSFAGRPQVILLQLLVPKNSRGIYAADFSPNAMDGEFILPRGTTVEVMSDPQNLVGSDAISAAINLEVVYIDCKVKT